jgi:hypothetical protein
VVFYFRKITSSSYTPTTITSVGTNYKATIEAAMFDEIGLEFYFKITDAIGDTRETTKNFVYLALPTAGQNIPFSKSGGTKESYELFSIPYQLADNSIANIFEELGAPNKAKYRLLRYQGGKNVDYGDGLTKIELGKGYWFNSKENVSINFSGGTVSQNNQSTDFILRLESGWNQIGNPFTFNVDWDDIVNQSANKDQIGKLKVFNPTQFTLTDESNNLKSWSGGFVFNSSTQAIELKIPVTLKNSAGGRKGIEEILTSSLDSQNWFVPIAVSQEGITNYSTGVGMHSEASLSKDKYDEVIEPRFINYLEFYTTHTDYFAPWFSKDVVPAAAAYNWDFKFESNLQGATKLSWGNKNWGDSDAQLLLFDQSNRVLVDMKTVDQYSFIPTTNQSFKVFFGKDERSISPDIIAGTSAWPNPFVEETNVSFVVKDAESAVLISVLDLTGRVIKTIVNGNYASGVYSTNWKGDDASDQPVSNGVYLLRFQVNGFSMVSRVIKK